MTVDAETAAAVPPPRITHVIFDMVSAAALRFQPHAGTSQSLRALLRAAHQDGLLLDTESAYTVAQQHVCNELGKEFTWELKAKMVRHVLHHDARGILHLAGGNTLHLLAARPAPAAAPRWARKRSTRRRCGSCRQQLCCSCCCTMLDKRQRPLLCTKPPTATTAAFRAPGAD